MRWVYGRHPVAALIEMRPRDVRRLHVAREAAESPEARAARDAGVPVETAPREKLEALARTTQHQGFVAEAQEFPYAEIEDTVPSDRPALVLVLDSIQDPHNLGALVRSAECLGATGVVIPQDRAAAVTGAAAKAAAGALERLPVARVVNLARALDRLKELGVWATGLAAEGAQDLGGIDFTGPSALVVGAEGGGLRRLVRERCDYLARIPMTGRTPSLNASVAGAIALWTAAAQRSGAAPRPGARNRSATGPDERT